MFCLLQGKTLYFAVFLPFFFLLSIQIVCFDWLYLVMQGFCLQSRPYLGLRISKELVEIYKFHGFDLIFVQIGKL